MLLEKIADSINNHNPDFTSHLLLSIFKMAEVEIVQVEPSSASRHLPHKAPIIIIIMLLTSSILEKISLALS